MTKISKIKAREILDSRGIPTIETEVVLEDGSKGIASIPSGSSKGKHEAVELRDQDPARFDGMGVLKAVDNVNKTITPELIGKDAAYQGNIDKILIELDGTEDKRNLGANALLSVSQGVLEASAESYNMDIYDYLLSKYQMVNKPKIPTPIFNLINGGKHGAGNLDFQEFHVIPSTRKSYPESLQCGMEIYQSLKKTLIEKGAIHSVGIEGGFAPNLYTNTDALELLIEAIRKTNYHLATDFFFGLDVAASYFYKNNTYHIKDKSHSVEREELIEYYMEINNKYHLFSIEDPLQEDDWKGWQILTKNLQKNTMVVGDDLLCTNHKRVKKAIKEDACNAILVKPNEVGTITELVSVIQTSRDAGWQIIISHRSGETTDDFIADFAVGVGADYTKFGAPARGERIIKYNRLLQINDNINSEETEEKKNEPA